MKHARGDRVRWVLAGVLRQVMTDTNAQYVTITGDDGPADFIRELCIATLGAESLQPTGLRLHAENKTALLLGNVPAADILLLGDLYYSQVVELTGSASLSPELTELAAACGGIAALDRALTRYYDNRESWDTAVAELPAAGREMLRQALDVARFKRARVGLVPKLGARTLGIDLYA